MHTFGHRQQSVCGVAANCSYTTYTHRQEKFRNE